MACSGCSGRPSSEALPLRQEVHVFAGERHVLLRYLDPLLHAGEADAEFAGLIAELKRRYTAPLMKVLPAAQRSGEIRQDLPLPLVRDMVYGSMEHVLWDTMVNRNKPDI